MTASSLYDTLTVLAHRFAADAAHLPEGNQRTRYLRNARQLRTTRTLVLNGTQTTDYGWSVADAAAGQLIRTDRSTS